VPHGAFGGPGYVRPYGWGWLGLVGVVMVIAGVIVLADSERSPFWPWLIYGGLLTAFSGSLLNGLSERRRMRKVHARCRDVEVRHLGGTTSRSGGWAVRALVSYKLDGQPYDSTPGQFGYVLLASEQSAEAFAGHLRQSDAIPLHVDPGHPTRSLFQSIGVPKGAVR